MTHSPADVVRWALIRLGLGANPTSANPSWPVYAAYEPPTPDNCITVYDTDGTDHGRSMPTGQAMGPDGVQIRVRATSHQVGWQKMDAIRTAMEAYYQQTVPLGTTAYRYLIHCFSNIGNILPLGKETPTSDRVLFTLNAVTPIRQLV